MAGPVEGAGILITARQQRRGSRVGARAHRDDVACEAVLGLPHLLLHVAGRGVTAVSSVALIVRQ